MGCLSSLLCVSGTSSRDWFCSSQGSELSSKLGFSLYAVSQSTAPPALVILQQSEGFAFLHSPTCIRGSTCIVCGFTCSWSVCCQHAAGGLFHKGQSPGTGEHLTCPRPSVDRVDCLHPIHRVEILGRQAFDTTILCQRTWV